ncbi:HDOD domain-containing protein [Pseudomonas putida]|nr:HDOD domain-containing protein [Pseudomonas putida]
MHTLDLILSRNAVPFTELPKGLPRPPHGHPVSPYIVRAEGNPAIVLLGQNAYLTPGNYPEIIKDFAVYDRSTIAALLDLGKLECMTILNEQMIVYIDESLLEMESIVLPTGKLGHFVSVTIEDFKAFLGDSLIATQFTNTRVSHEDAWNIGVYNERRIDQLIVQDSKIPPFPETARRIIDLFQRQDSFDMDELVTVIEQDAPISAQTISWANAAAGGSAGKPIVNVRNAVSRLGVNKTMQYAMQSSVSNSFRVTADLANMLEDACFNSLVSAYGAGQVHREEGGQSPQSAYLVGLMHNLGELLLMHVLPEQSQRFVQLHQMNPHLSRESLSSEVFMISFASATHLLMKAWGMPENMVESCMALATYSDEGADPLANNVRSWQVSMGDSGIVPISFVPHGWRNQDYFPVSEAFIEKRRREINEFRTQASMISRRAI